MCLQDIFLRSMAYFICGYYDKILTGCFFLVLFHKLFARTEIFARIKENRKCNRFRKSFSLREYSGTAKATEE